MQSNLFICSTVANIDLIDISSESLIVLYNFDYVPAKSLLVRSSCGKRRRGMEVLNVGNNNETKSVIYA